MQERHENEQYFFDARTVERLVGILARFENPCCLCAPTVGKELAERKVSATILDIDVRFAFLTGFRHYDLTRPTYVTGRFGVILCDPPFFNLSLTELYTAIALLSHHDFSQPLLLAYVTRRKEALLRRFEAFGLRETGHVLGYNTVATTEKTTIELFANFELGPW